MKLSIGMIVKNEEKYLRDCLEALSSLRQNIECELIIADTGSTDGTKEIAAQYADILFDFEWCGDFSAARNATLDRASGNWFMFLDADEIFDSTAEIEAFFQGDECREYHSASFNVHSYVKEDKSEVLDFQCQRFFDLSFDDARFIYKIHEAIPAHPPTKFFTDFVHHWGYVMDGVTDVKKTERNMAFLMSELEKNPNDVRTLAHLVREFSPLAEADEIIKYADQGLRALKKDFQRAVSQGILPKTARLADASMGYFSLTHQKILALYNKKEWAEVVSACEQYFKGRNGIFRSDIDVYWFMADAQYKLEKYADAAASFKEYLDLYNQKQQGGLVTEDMMSAYIQCDKEYEYRGGLLEMASGCIQGDLYDDAFFFLELLLQVDSVGQLRPAFLCMEKSGRYEYLLTLWQHYSKGDKPEEIEKLLYFTETYIIEHENIRDELIRLLMGYTGDESYNYVLLNHMRFCYHNERDAEAREDLQELLACRPFSRLLADSIYYAMRFNMDLSVLFDAVSVDDLRFYFADIKNAHKDFADTVAHYFEWRQFGDTPKGLYWSVMLQESAILTNNLYDEEALPLLERYLDNLIVYSHALYNAELFNEQDLGILPASARFAHYMHLAKEAGDGGNEMGYVKNIGKAIAQYKAMAKPMKLLAKRYSEQGGIQEQAARGDSEEMEGLAKQVKAQIFSLINKQQFADAAQILEEYEKIATDDPDIAFLRQRTQLSGGGLYS